MSVKMCAYKNCSNYSVNNVSCGTEALSLFGFPKDPSRREEWIKLAKVKPLAEDQLFMCSKHFDPKFISVNKRRSVLLGVAKPFPYSAGQGDVASERESQEDLEHSLKYLGEESQNEDEEQSECSQIEEAHFNEGDLPVESAMPDDEYGNVIQDTDYIDTDSGSNSIEVLEQPCLKRENQQVSSDEPKPKVMKILLNNMQICTVTKKLENCVTVKAGTTPTKPKLRLQSNPQIISKKASPEPKTTEIDEDELVSGKDVTTFIFKGEEYVQMPRAHYVQEKLALMRKIKQYQSVLTSFKKQLGSLNLS